MTDLPLINGSRYLNASRPAPPHVAYIEPSGGAWRFPRKMYFRLKLIYFALLVAMYFGLAQAYAEFWQPLFDYAHFQLSYVPEREVESLIVLFAAAALTPTCFRRPSDVFVSLSILTILVPTAMMFAYGDMDAETAYLTYLGLALIYLTRDIPLYLPDFRWSSASIVIQLVTLVAIIGVLLTAYEMGFSDFSFAFFDVYGRRELAAAHLTGIVGYIVGFGLAANQLAIILSVNAKIWPMLAINLAGSAFYFGLIGNKGPLFMLPIFLFLNYALQRRWIIAYIFFIMSVDHHSIHFLFSGPNYLGCA